MANDPTPTNGPDPIKLTSSDPDRLLSNLGSGQFGKEAVGDTGKSQYDNPGSFVDPNRMEFDIHPDDIAQSQLDRLESNRDAFQPWYDKLGNGLAKFGSTLGASVLSVPGTIYGIPASLIPGGDNFWDNPFSRMGDDLVTAANENFRNYKSMDEIKSSAWSPDHWATLNFFSDAILGNAGYAVGAYVTGTGLSSIFKKLAPLVATGKLKDGLNIARTQGVEALEKFADAAKSVRRFDRIQAGTSLMMSAMSEASVEALGSYNEYKQSRIAQLAAEYGGEEFIPKSQLDKLETEANSVGNITYGLNTAILSVVDGFQFGKSLMGFKQEVQAAKRNVYKLDQNPADGPLGDYASKQLGQREAAVGFRNKFTNVLRENVLPGLKNNFSESAQEGLQFIASKGTQNYYARKHDPQSQEDADNLLSAYLEAGSELFTSKEGVANLLAGFGTPMAMPVGPGGIFNHQDIVKLFRGDKEKQDRTNQMIKALNDANAKGNLKSYFESVVRDGAIQRDLNQAIGSNDEFSARNLQNDRLKNYIESRIRTGRYDLLQDELKALSSMSKEEFNKYFDIQDGAQFDHQEELRKFGETAKEMNKTWQDLDILFRPGLYKLNGLTGEEKQKAVAQMEGFKEQAWSYLMDARDSDKRLNTLRSEVDQGFNNIVTVSEMFQKKTGNEQLDDLINQYNISVVEEAVGNFMDQNEMARNAKPQDPKAKVSKPVTKDKTEVKFRKGLRKRLKAMIQQQLQNFNSKDLSLPDFIDKGDPNFIEEYIFDFEKKMDELAKNGSFSRFLDGLQLYNTDSDALFDISAITNKMYDYRKLSMRRMRAVNAYNNLGIMIRSGKFMNSYIENPDYTPENGQPQYIVADDFLKTDQYGEFQAVKDDYKKAQEIEAKQNDLEKEAFEKLLEDQYLRTQKFQSKVDIHRFEPVWNGKNITELTGEEFTDFGESIQVANMHDGINRRFDTSDPEVRSNFEYEAFMDRKAREMAFEQEAEKRDKEFQERLNAMVSAIATEFRNTADASGVAEAQRLFDQYLKDNPDMPDEVREALIAKVDELVAEYTNTKDAEDEQEAEDAPVIGESGIKRPESPEQIKATQQEKEAIVPGAAVPPVLNPPAEPKESVTITDANIVNTNVEKESKTALESAFDIPYLMLRRMDVEVEKVIRQVNLTSRNIHNIVNGSIVVIDEKRYLVGITFDDKYILQGEKSNMSFDNPTAFADFVANNQVKWERSWTENKRDAQDKLITKQFNADFFDVHSPMYIGPGRELRLEKSGVGGTKVGNYAFAKVMYKDVDGIWKATGYSFALDPSKVDSVAGAENIPVGIRDRIKTEVAAISDLLWKGKNVTVRVLPNGMGIGKLINTSLEANTGQHKPIGLDKAVGIESINNPRHNDPVYLGVINGDGQKNASIAHMKGDNMEELGSSRGIYIAQSSIDAITKTNKTNVGREGQLVAVVPTALMKGSQRVHIPLLLNTRNIKDDLSGKYIRPDGEAMSLPEALLEVIANPSKPEHQQSMMDLFKLVGLKYDIANPDYGSFYNNENIHKIFDKLVFTAGKSFNEKYKYPFAIYASYDEVTKMEDGKRVGTGKHVVKITVELTRDTTRLSTMKKRADIYVTYPDGKVNEKPIQERLDEYFDKKAPSDLPQATTEKPISHLDILDRLAEKPYRVDIKEVSMPSGTDYDAIVFDADGNLRVQRYPSYHHYLAANKIVQATFEGISSERTNTDGSKTARRSYFLNNAVKFVREEVSDAVVGSRVRVSARNARAAANGNFTENKVDPKIVEATIKRILANSVIPKMEDRIKDAENILKEFPSVFMILPNYDSADAFFKGEFFGGETLIQAIRDSVIKTEDVKPSIKEVNRFLNQLFANDAQPNVVDRLKDIREILEIFKDSVVPLFPEELINQVATGDIDARSRLISQVESYIKKNSNTPTSSAASASIVLTSADGKHQIIPGQFANYENAPKSPEELQKQTKSEKPSGAKGPDLAGMMDMDLGNAFPDNANPFFDIADKVPGVNQLILNERVRSRMPALIHETTQVMMEVLYSVYKQGKSITLRRNALKNNTLAKLQDELEELQKMINFRQASKQEVPIEMKNRLGAITFIIRYFDSKDFDKTLNGKFNTFKSAEQEKAFASRGRRVIGTDEHGAPIYKYDYFVGFFQLGMSNLMKTKVVQGDNNTEEQSEVVLDNMEYSTRFDSNWSFKIDPRDTIGKYSRLIMNRIPEMIQLQDGSWETSIGITGRPMWLSYESVHKTMLETFKDIHPTKAMEFFESIPENEDTKNNNILYSIYRFAQEYKNDTSQDAYHKLITQLINPNLQQQVNFHVLRFDTKANRNAKDRSMNLSRQMINDKIVSIWSTNLARKIRMGKYVEVRVEKDPTTGDVFTNYYAKPISHNGKDMSWTEYITTRINEAAEEKTFKNQMLALAKVYIEDFDMPLTDSGKVEDTANVLSTLARTKKNSTEKVFQKHFPEYRTYGNNIFQFAEKTLKDLIVQPILSTLAGRGVDNIRSTFNPEQPLAESTDVINRYVKAVRYQFKDVVNAVMRDHGGNMLYGYSIHNQLSQELLQLKDINYLWTLVNTPAGRNHPIIGALFERDATGNYISKEAIETDNMNRFLNMELDYMREMVQDNWMVTEAADMGAGIWEIASLKQFQNAEKLDKAHKNKLVRNRNGHYLMSFADATTAPYFKAPKYNVAFDIVLQTDGHVRFLLKDYVGENQVSMVRKTIHNIMKAELMRAAGAIKAFNKAKGNKKKLRYGVDYIKVGNKVLPGPAAYIYNFGETMYNRVLDSGLFEVTEIEGKRYIIGIEDKATDEFSSFIENELDTIVSEFIETKIKQLTPYMDHLLKMEFKTDMDTQVSRLTTYKFPLFDNDYVNTFSSLIQGDNVQIHDGDETHQLSQYQRYTKTDLNEQEVTEKGYPKLLLYSMIADQQLNHLIFRSTFHTMYGIDPAQYAKANRVDYDSFITNWDKRMKQMVTPLYNVVTPDNDRIRILTYQDPRAGDIKKTYHFNKPVSAKTGTPMQRYMMTNFFGRVLQHPELSKRISKFVSFEKNDKEFTSFTLPVRTFDHLPEALLAANREAWADKLDIPQVQAILDKLVKYWNQEMTDGNTYITLKEYVYQSFKEGKINKGQAIDIIRYYRDPKIKRPHSLLPLQVVKNVATGSKIEGNRRVQIYKKDAEFVLAPSMTDGNPILEQLREDLEALEGDSFEVAPGVVYAPVSAMKLGATEPHSPLKEDGSLNSKAIKGAAVDVWPGYVRGKQVQNPNKKLNRVTSSTQADKFLHHNIGMDLVFGDTQFSAEDPAYEENSDIHNMTVEEMLANPGKLNVANIKKPNKPKRSGLTNRRIMTDKFFIKGELKLRKLQALMSDWGLRYDEKNTEYNSYVSANLGLNPKLSETFATIQKMANDRNHELRSKAITAIGLKDRIVAYKLQQMIEDIKEQAYARRGVDINNLFALSLAEGLNDMMEIPTTFTPSSAQFQAIVLSRIDDIAVGDKLPGFSGAQVSGFGISRSGTVERNDKGKIIFDADDTLRHYRPIYNTQMEMVGYHPSEVVLPWRLRDASGKLLDYNKYCHEDGTPREDMWDDELLTIVGLRIPGTGLNTLSRMRAVRFFKPGIVDMVAVAPEIATQMNSDHDFDKIPFFMHHYQVEPITGRLKKIQGVLDPRDKDMLKKLNNPENQKQIIRALLLKENPNYWQKVSELSTMIKATLNEMERFSDYDEGVIEMIDDVRALSEAQQVQFIQERGEYTKDQMKPFLTLQKEIQKIEEYGLSEFMQEGSDGKFRLNMPQFLASARNAVYAAQTDQQLENALLDSYHLILSNPEVFKQMVDPLTTDYVVNAADGKHYNGKSLRQFNVEGKLRSPLSEAHNTDVRVTSAGADRMIANSANALSQIHLGQAGLLYAGVRVLPDESEGASEEDYLIDEESVVTLYNDEGELIGEDEGFKDNTIHRAADEQAVIDEASKNPLLNKAHIMHLRQIGDVRYKLNAFYGFDKNGDKVYVTKVIQSLLQASLDNLNDPVIGVVNYNLHTSNAAIAMAMLRYFDHLIPMLNQPIIREFTRFAQLASLNGGKANDAFADVREQYEREIMPKNMNDEEANMWLQQFSVKVNQIKVTPNLLVDHIVQANEDPSGFRKNVNAIAFQFAVLKQFENLHQIGSNLLSVQQKLNVDSKGLAGTTLVDAQDQYEKYNSTLSPYIINANALREKPFFNHKNSYNYGLKPVRDIFERGNIGMFEDLKPAMLNIRKTAQYAFSGVNPHKLNINLIQFLLNDPALFKGIIGDMKLGKHKIKSMRDLRDMIMKERYSVGTDGVYNLANNLNQSLAARIDAIKDEIDPESQLSYTSRYEILGNIKNIIQPNNDKVSMVLHQNANNYKQHLELLLPSSIVDMMNAQDERLRDIGKLLLLYPYIIGGTNSPTAFIRSVPVETLVQAGFGKELRKKMATLNKAFTMARNEMFQVEDQDRVAGVSQAIRIIGGQTKLNPTARKVITSFLYQYAQSNPFDIPQANIEDFEKVAPDTYRYKVKNVPGENDYGKVAVGVRVSIPTDVEGGTKNVVMLNDGDATDPLFKVVDTLGYYAYGIKEYDYNIEGTPARSVITSNRFDGTPEAEAPETESMAILTVPYMQGAKPNVAETPEWHERYTSTAGRELSWIANYSDARATMATTPEEIKTNKEFAELARYLKSKVSPLVPVNMDNYLTHKNVRVSALTVSGPNGGIERISFNPSAEMANAGGDRANAYRYIMMHEFAHGATQVATQIARKLQQNTISRERAKELLNVNDAELNRIVSAYDKLETILQMINTKHTNGIYQAFNPMDYDVVNNALSNVDEFIATIFMDRRFRQALNNINLPGLGSKTKSIWKRLKELFMDLLGIREGSALESAFSNILELVETSRDTPPSGGKNTKTPWVEDDVDNANPLFDTDINTVKEALFNLRLSDQKAISEGKITVTVSPDILVTGVYKIGQEFYRITLRNERPELISQQPDAKGLANKILGIDGIVEENITQGFLENKHPLFIYDLKKLEVTEDQARALPDFKGVVKFRRKASITGERLTDDVRVDKYVAALTEAKINLMREMPTAKSDPNRMHTLRAEVDFLDRQIEILTSQADTHAIVEVATVALNHLRFNENRISNLVDIHEAMRITKAYMEMAEVIDINLDNPTDEEAQLIADTKNIIADAAGLFNKFNLKFVDLLATQMEDTLGKSVRNKLFDPQTGKLKIVDIDKFGAMHISSAFSGNELEQYLDAVLKSQEKKANVEYYEFEKELAKRVKEMFGDKEPTAKDFDFMFTREGNSKSLVLTYSKDFYKELYTKRYQAFGSKKDRADALALGATAKELKDKISAREYYLWESNYMENELTAEGSNGFDKYMEGVLEQLTTGWENGERVYDEAEYNRIYRQYDPEVFKEFLDNPTKKRSNKGSIWFTKTMKTTVPLSEEYKKMNEQQREFYKFYVDEIKNGQFNMAIDYRFNEADLDRLLLEYNVRLAEGLSDKMQYLGKELKSFARGITHVPVGGNVQAKIPTRVLTGTQQVIAEFQPIGEFLPDSKSQYDVNPIDVLKQFRLSGHTYNRKREVEDTINALRDVVINAEKIETMQDGALRTSVMGTIMTSKHKTNVADRLDFTAKSWLTNRVKEDLKPTAFKKEDESGKNRDTHQFSMWQVADSVNNYTRFTSMALSPLSGAGNMVMGALNNFLYAGGGQYFNDKQLSEAYWIIKDSIAKYYSHGNLVTDNARKISELFFKYNVIGDVTEKMYHGGDRLSWFFTLQKGGEYLNQGATAIAQMINTKVEGTDLRLWDLFKLDENGKVYLDESLLPADSKWRDQNHVNFFFERIIKVNQRVHGDYVNPIMAKANLAGRVYMLFRTWLPMAFKERFGSQYEDRVLGEQKGRYVSVAQLVVQDPKRLLKIFAKLALPFIGRKIDIEGIKEIDKENLMMFIREMHLIATMVTATLLLKTVAEDDDDDKKDISILRYLYNQGERAQSELMFFFYPRDTFQILRDVVPMFQTVKNTYKFLDAAGNYIVDPENDIYKRGFRKGSSKTATAFMEAVPVARSVQKTWSSAAQIFNDSRY